MDGIRLEGVRRVFPLEGGEVRALEDLSLRVPWGSLTAVVGRSGCGKTTLLRLVAGLNEPTAGRVRFLQGSEDLPREAVRVGLVFQEPRLMPWLSVEENLAFPLVGRLGREEIRRRVDPLLELLGLEGFRRALPGQVSGGMAQRVALGRTLAHDPDVVLLDEPFGSLDYFTRRALQGEIGELHRRTGKTFLLVTHDVDEALALGDSVVVLRQGRLADRVEVPFPRPRDVDDPVFAPLKRSVLGAIGGTAEDPGRTKEVEAS